MVIIPPLTTDEMKTSCIMPSASDSVTEPKNNMYNNVRCSNTSGPYHFVPSGSVLCRAGEPEPGVFGSLEPEPIGK